MKKLFRFSVVFGLAALMLWLIPHLSTAVSAPDSLTIAKSDGITQVIAGDGISHRYLITVTNTTGSSPARPVVTDTWPTGVTRIGVTSSRGSCATTNPNDFTCSLGNMPGGARAVITATYTVPAGANPGIYTNTVRTAASGIPPVSTADANRVLAVASLHISKSDGLSQLTAGDGITHHYAITVTNSGPSLASSVLVTDTWPVGFTRGAVSRSQGSCNTADPNNFICSLGSIPVGGRATITATYTVPSTTPSGTYGNLARAKSPASIIVSALDSDNVFPSPNLAISKSDGVTNVVAGDGIPRRYVITLNNPGPLLATSVLVTDTWPAGFTRGALSQSQGNCSPAGPDNFTCSLGAIQIGSRAMITASYTVPSTAPPGTYTNLARAKSPVSVLVSASDADTVSATATLAMAKSDSRTQVTAGDGISHRYAITVTNSGPSLASSVLVTDTWPVGFTRGNVSRSQGSCDTTNPDNFTCSLGAIQIGSRATITASYTVPSTTPPGTYTNQARAKSPASSLVSISDADTVSAIANLAISKSDSLSQVTAGDGITHHYAITVTNSGPSLASSVLVTDTWPVGFTRGSVSRSQGSCDTTNANNFTCAVGSIPVGSRATITATYTVPSITPPGTYTNQVRATSPASSLVSVSDIDTVSAVANLAISKSDSLSQVTAGDGITHRYAITVTNSGPSLASSILVTDTWPVGFTRGSVSRSQGSCDTTNPNNFTCAVGSIPVSSRATITATYTVPAITPPGVLTNSVHARSPVTDPTPTNNSTSDQTSVATVANLSLSMSDAPDPVVAGNYLTYTLQTTNPGPSLAVGVSISDTLPAGLAYISSGSSLGCSPNGQTITCSLGNVFPGTNRQVLILTLVNPSLSGTITNRARVTSSTSDPSQANNMAQVDTTVLVPDTIPPTVSWVEPIDNDLSALSVGCEVVHFLVTATDNIGVQRVRFYWWDPFRAAYIDIGSDTSAPYEWDFFTDSLHLNDQNQIFATAYDLVGNQSAQKRIILKKIANCRHYYLPAVAR